MALLANFVFAMPLANFLIMFNKYNPSENFTMNLFFKTADRLWIEFHKISNLSLELKPQSLGSALMKHEN
jgi:hypothetical protein